MKKSYYESVQWKLDGNRRGAEVAAQIADAMFPEGNPDHEWSADTLDQIAEILRDFKLLPEHVLDK